MMAKQKNKGGLTVKQEKFAQAFVEIGDKSAAYRKVFSCKKMTDKSINERACVTSKIIKVESRIKDLQAATLKRHEITVDSLAAEYDEAKKLALKIERPEAAIKAIDGKARITGHDKKSEKDKDSGTVVNINIGKDDLVKARKEMLEKDDC